ncbi:MAG: hypothetical protein ACOC6A_00855 [Chloroflexota bacterium]
MDIQWLRDVIICVTGGIATITFIVFGILGISLYRKVMGVMDSVQNTSLKAQSVLDAAHAAVDAASLRTNATLDVVLGSVEGLCASLREITSCVRSEITRPLMRVTSVLQRMREGLERMSTLFRRRERSSER